MSQELHDSIFTAWLLGEEETPHLKQFAPLFYGYPKWVEEELKPLENVRVVTKEEVDEALDAIQAVIDNMESPGDVIVFDSWPINERK